MLLFFFSSPEVLWLLALDATRSMEGVGASGCAEPPRRNEDACIAFTMPLRIKAHPREQRRVRPNTTSRTSVLRRRNPPCRIALTS